MSEADYQRGFTEGMEYARSKLLKRHDIKEAEVILDDIIARLKAERFQSFDEALMLLE